MPRNFDELREDPDLEFTISGETFRMHRLPWNQMDAWIEREGAMKKDKKGEQERIWIERVADAVGDGNGSSERWTALCHGDKAPSYGELVELANWALELQHELPTMPPKPSEPGREKTASSSKGG